LPKTGIEPVRPEGHGILSHEAQGLSLILCAYKTTLQPCKKQYFFVFSEYFEYIIDFCYIGHYKKVF